MLKSGLQFFADSDPVNADSGETAPAVLSEEKLASAEDAARTAAELKKLQADFAKQKAALDKAAKEAAEFKKQLRENKSAEERRAEEEQERKEAIEAELNELRKKAAVAEISSQVLSFAGNEESANAIAAALYGAEDAEGAIGFLSKAWAEREKKLRLEFTKLPAPAAGENAPQIPREAFVNMSYKERLELANKHPETYEKLRHS